MLFDDGGEVVQEVLLEEFLLLVDAFDQLESGKLLAALLFAMLEQSLGDDVQHFVPTTQGLEEDFLHFVDERRSEFLLAVVHVEEKAHFGDPCHMHTSALDDLSHFAHVFDSLEIFPQSAADFLLEEGHHFLLPALLGEFVDGIVGQLVGNLLALSHQYAADVVLEVLHELAELSLPLQLLQFLVVFHNLNLYHWAC